MKCAIYARVSTDKQKTDMQLTDLREYVRRAGWESVEYLETESSVKKRPVFERMMQEAKQDSDDGQLTSLEERLAHDEYQSRIEKLRQEIEAEIRRRLVADRGVEAMARTLRKPLPEDVDFMHATRDEMGALRLTVTEQRSG